MNIQIDHLAFFISGALLAVTALGLGISFVMPDTGHRNRRFFVALFAIQMLYMFAVTADLIVYSNPSMATAEKIAAFFEYLILSMTMPLFTDLSPM